MSRSPSEASREFMVRGWQILTRQERAERESRLDDYDFSPAEFGLYDGKELKRDPGIPASRYRAFELPSRAWGQLRYPDGRIEPFPEPSSSQPPARS